MSLILVKAVICSHRTATFSDTLGDNQACTLFGSRPGSMVVTGADYLKVGYSLDVADQWRRNFVVLIGFFIAFQVTQLLLIEFFPVRFNSPIV